MRPLCIRMTGPVCFFLLTACTLDTRPQPGAATAVEGACFTADCEDDPGGAGTGAPVVSAPLAPGGRDAGLTVTGTPDDTGAPPPSGGAFADAGLPGSRDPGEPPGGGAPDGSPSSPVPTPNSGCVAGGFDCDESGACTEGDCPAPDGETCVADDECESGHCGGGVCCRGDDCCRAASECPASYTVAATCDWPERCQGLRADAACVDFICVTGEKVDDDSACGAEILSDSCGPVSDLYCTGSQDQPNTACPATCAGDNDCDDDAYCTPSGACEPKMPDGDECREDTACQSGHCGAGHCCAAGDCCQNAFDCLSLGYMAWECNDTSACAGVRYDPVCNASSICELSSEPVAGPLACAISRPDACGLQGIIPVCTSNDDCDEGGMCVAGVCLAVTTVPGDPDDLEILGRGRPEESRGRGNGNGNGNGRE